MRKTILVGMLAAAGAFAGVLANGARSQAADEIRCRVNAEALLSDLAALTGKTTSPGQMNKDREDLERILNSKKP